MLEWLSNVTVTQVRTMPIQDRIGHTICTMTVRARMREKEWGMIGALRS
jgi:hypothetical protein